MKTDNEIWNALLVANVLNEMTEHMTSGGADVETVIVVLAALNGVEPVALTDDEQTRLSDLVARLKKTSIQIGDQIVPAIAPKETN